jgi:uncharacterized protein (TIGR02266 family)
MSPDDPSSKKAPTVLRIKLRYEDQATFVERFAGNIGRSGLFIRSRTPKPIGTEIRFELRLHDDTPVVIGLGVVRWIRDYDPARPRAVHGMGVEFLRVTRESRDVLMRVLEHRRKLGLVDGPGGIPEPPEDEETRVRPAGDLSGPTAIAEPARDDQVTAVRPAPTRAGRDTGAPPERPRRATGTSPPPAPRPRTPSSVPPPTSDVRDVRAAPTRAETRPEPVAAIPRPAPLPPREPRRPRPSAADLVAQASTADADPGLAFVEDGLDVASTLRRARSLAGADPDRELRAILDGGAAPLPITIDDASARLAALVGGPAVAARRARIGRSSSPPPIVAEGTQELPTSMHSGPTLSMEAETSDSGDVRALVDTNAITEGVTVPVTAPEPAVIASPMALAPTVPVSGPTPLPEPAEPPSPFFEPDEPEPGDDDDDDDDSTARRSSRGFVVPAAPDLLSEPTVVTAPPPRLDDDSDLNEPTRAEIPDLSGAVPDEPETGPGTLISSAIDVRARRDTPSLPGLGALPVVPAPRTRRDSPQLPGVGEGRPRASSPLPGVPDDARPRRGTPLPGVPSAHGSIPPVIHGGPPDPMGDDEPTSLAPQRRAERHSEPPGFRGREAPSAAADMWDLAPARQTSSGSIDITDLVSQLEAQNGVPIHDPNLAAEFGEPHRPDASPDLVHSLDAAALGAEELSPGRFDGLGGRRRPPDSQPPDLASFADPPDAPDTSPTPIARRLVHTVPRAGRPAQLGPRPAPRPTPERLSTVDDIELALDSLDVDGLDPPSRPPSRPSSAPPVRRRLPTDDDIEIDIDLDGLDD